ncbi:MAG: NlpC/P60 family protein [Alphaproteobacteria bacterium]|nr:NlpC/P60 family protein [Alphaproteobacteria bacterium]
MAENNISQLDYLLAEIESWLGTPYSHQASCKGVGADCLGFIRGIYRALFGCEPETPPPYQRHASPQEGEILWQAARQYLREIEPSESQIGDVLLFRMQPELPARHLAILVRDGFMVHAAEGHHVLKTRYGRWWQRRLVSAFRFPLSQPTASATLPAAPPAPASETPAP